MTTEEKRALRRTLLNARREPRICKDGHRRWVPRPMTPEESHAWFLLNIARDDASGCWNWTGVTGGWHPLRQYGTMTLNRKHISAHRFSYQYFNKTTIPAGLQIRHKCDNTRCVNPDHLDIGTAKDNARDMMERGRFRRAPIRFGNDNKSSKITEQQAREVWRLIGEGRKVVGIASETGVPRTTVSAIKRGSAWRWMTGLVKPGERERMPMNKKLTADRVREIIQQLKTGDTLAAIGARFGVSSVTIRVIRDGKGWKSVPRD